MRLVNNTFKSEGLYLGFEILCRFIDIQYQA